MDDNQKQLIIDRIRQGREETGLSTRDFAKKFDLSSSRVQSWECGHRIPRTETFAEISHIYNRFPGYLAGYTNEKNNKQPRYAVADCQQYSPLSFNEDILKQKNITEVYMFMFTVLDNLMSPTFSKGDHVLIDKTKKPKINNKINLFAVSKSKKPEKIFVRWIELSNDNIRVTHCKNKLPDDDEYYNLDDWNVIGKVIGNWHWFEENEQETQHDESI